MFEFIASSSRRRAATLVLAAAALSAGAVLPGLASQQGPLVVTVTTSPNPYAIEGSTSVSHSVGVLGYGTGATDVALEGYATQPGSVGLEGFSSSASGTAGNGIFGYSANGSGVYGVSATATYAPVFGASSVAAGTGVEGMAQGNGVYGTSTNENGVYGVTTSSSTTLTSTPAGVFGEDAEGADLDSGVVGMSVGDGYGVMGVSKTGDGMLAQSTSGYGLYVLSLTGTGVYANAPGTNATAIQADASTGTAVLAVADSGGAVNGTGVIGHSYNDLGIGVQGWSDGANSLGLAALVDNASATGLEVNAYYGTPIRAYSTPNSSTSETEIMELANNGDLTISGAFTGHGTPSSVIADERGVARVTYSPQQTQTSLEDFGEGRLAAGRASVALDPAFAALAARGVPYLVFVTPQGETPGLYVANKTASGFAVAEYGARSSIAFDYRIVARPRGADLASRLPLYVAPVAPAPRGMSAHERADAIAARGTRSRLAFKQPAIRAPLPKRAAMPALRAP